MMTDITMVHVPYRGGGPALTDLLGGQVQVMFPGTAASIEHIRAGRLRALAVTTATRLQVLPDIPTMSEFVPGYEASAWNGIGAPKNTPAEIIERLNKEINAALADLEDEGAARRTRRQRSCRLACRFRQPYRRRNREVGQGSEVCGHQAGVMQRGNRQPRYSINPVPRMAAITEICCKPLFDNLRGGHEQHRRGRDAEQLGGLVSPNGSSGRQGQSDMLCAQELPMRTCRCPFQRQPLCQRQASHCQINSLAFHRIPNGYRTYADQSTV